MNIGCIGWGSLTWNPGTLPIRNGWFEDGPLLPVEFARQSSGNRITLVLVPTTPCVRTLWCLLVVEDLSAARNALAQRESVLKSKEQNIGFWTRTSGSSGQFEDVIGAWAEPRQLDAVVWTNLGPKWGKTEGLFPSFDDVMHFVQEKGPNSDAAEYIRKAPHQIDTNYRRRLIAELPWLWTERQS